MLVGPTGSAVGIDIRQSAINMATDSVQRLMTDSPTFAAVAAPLQFGLHNVFMLNSTHKVCFTSSLRRFCTPSARMWKLIDPGLIPTKSCRPVELDRQWIGQWKLHTLC